MAEEIKVGMSGPLTGPLSEMGLSIQAGINAYFSKLNQQGGVKGKLVEFLALDDFYEPDQAAANMRQLINEHGVLAVLGNVGTPTAVVTVPIAEQLQVALVGAFSGGDVLRSNPPSRYIINYRPGYKQEVEMLIDGLLNAGIRPEEIAFFTQQDSYGNAVYHAAATALQAREFYQVDYLTHAYYSRNTLNVESAVATILKANIPPKVILMGGSYAPSAKFIKLLYEDRPDLWFVNVSFVGSHVLEQSLDGINANVIVSQVVPEVDADLPLVREFRGALKEYDSALQPNTVSLEGYIVAKIFAEALQNMEGNISRETLIDALHELVDLDIGLGSNINLDKNQQQGSNMLWLSRLENGAFHSFEWSSVDFSH
ncbi:ABC transporter substrate-binding protein [Methylophaga sp.]|uniref:ABC transporter substrate-binding protein n=1 Tax=Methylophaga sp. TaxID=2024840 RepID=UPI0027283F01|nr:ABC transporter substrate-binding protein [Methylophaga sp.]MDO8827419.1 ABC transporter substrate-binding protein [Methylophaga sp.]